MLGRVLRYEFIGRVMVVGKAVGCEFIGCVCNGCEREPLRCEFMGALVTVMCGDYHVNCFTCGLTFSVSAVIF